MPNNLSKDSSRFAPAHCIAALQQTIPNIEKRSPDFGSPSSQAPRAHPGGEREAKGMPLSGNLLLVLFGLYNKRSPWAIWTRDEIRPADFLHLSTGLFPTSDMLHGPHWIPRPVYPTCHINTDMCFWRDFGHLAIPIRLRILRGMVCARPFLHLNYAEAPRNGHRLARRWDHRPALGGSRSQNSPLVGIEGEMPQFQ